MALLAGSPAIDKGKNFGRSTDQRGSWRRYDLLSGSNAGGGDGSDIGAFEFLPTPRLTIQRANNNVVLSWTSDATDFLLQCVTNLPAANNWSNVISSRVTVGSQVYTTNPVVGARKFYRLDLPGPAGPP